MKRKSIILKIGLTHVVKIPTLWMQPQRLWLMCLSQLIFAAIFSCRSNTWQFRKQIGAGNRNTSRPRGRVTLSTNNNTVIQVHPMHSKPFEQ